jgi:predicted phage terminase large subunit-like protein
VKYQELLKLGNLNELFLAATHAKRANSMIDREDLENDFLMFLEAAWPSIDSAPFQSCWAIDAMAQHLEAVTLGHIKRLLINIPPRCAKTNTASICWNAWIWARSQQSFVSGPQVKFLSASYNSALSLMASNKTRRLIMSPFYQALWGDRFTLRLDQNSKSQFDNTVGGSRIATSVRGSLLGLGGDVICVDDPHNTETEKKIETDADRRVVASWYQELHGTRLNNPKLTPLVVVMQRLHKGDLSGIILDGSEPFVHVMVPMEFDSRRRSVTVILPQLDYEGKEPTPWADPRTDDDELMWPERFGHRELERMKHLLGPYMAAGRLQQSPIAKGGAILKRGWWKLWDMDVARTYGLEWAEGGRKEFPECSFICGSLDTSYGEKDENNFNALTVWGVWVDHNKNRRAMLMFAWAKRLPLHGQVLTPRPNEAGVNFRARQQREWGLVEWVADTCRRYKVHRLLIEDKTRGHDVANELRRLYARENFGIEMISVNKIDKVSRTHSVVSLFVDDVVWAPETKWSEEVLDQCEYFPRHDHDDLHDTVTQFLNWARERGILLRGDEMSAALEDEAAYKPKDHGVAEHYGV